MWSDSVRCGGFACLLLAVMDVVALVKGGRAEVPAGIGAALSGWALFQAFNPAWVAFLRH